MTGPRGERLQFSRNRFIKPRRKPQIPNPKLQTNFKIQIPNVLKERCCVWNLGFTWDLEREIWCFIRNQIASTRVFTCSVDAIWTWMILNLMRWFKPRFGMMRKRLANWCADSIRWSQKWCGLIGRDELLKRIFAK